MEEWGSWLSAVVQVNRHMKVVITSSARLINSMVPEIYAGVNKDLNRNLIEALLK